MPRLEVRVEEDGCRCHTDPDEAQDAHQGHGDDQAGTAEHHTPGHAHAEALQTDPHRSSEMASYLESEQQKPHITWRKVKNQLDIGLQVEIKDLHNSRLKGSMGCGASLFHQLIKLLFV